MPRVLNACHDQCQHRLFNHFYIIKKKKGSSGYLILSSFTNFYNGRYKLNETQFASSEDYFKDSIFTYLESSQSAIFLAVENISSGFAEIYKSNSKGIEFVLSLQYCYITPNKFISFSSVSL